MKLEKGREKPSYVYKTTRKVIKRQRHSALCWPKCVLDFVFLDRSWLDILQTQGVLHTFLYGEGPCQGSFADYQILSHSFDEPQILSF